MSRVLVIGGGGFIGGHLLPAMVANGAAVTATCRRGSEPPSVPGVDWLPTDLAAPDAAAGWPAAIDDVIYLAQARAWRSFPPGAADVFGVNVAGVFRAAEYARAARAKRLIYLSSGSVYPVATAPVTEDSDFPIPGARQFYPAAKLAAELLLGPYASFFPVITLRPFVPYGRGQSSDMLLPQLVARVGDGAAITLDGPDGLTLNPVAVADVVEAIVRTMRLTQTATLNVAGPDTISLRDVGKTIGAILSRPPVFEQRGGVAGVIVGDTSRLRATLGWAPATPLEKGLRDWIG